MEAAEPMTLAEAERLAAEEGLVLVPANNATGFKGVTGYSSNRYKAQINFGSKTKSLGICSSAAEAARWREAACVVRRAGACARRLRQVRRAARRRAQRGGTHARSSRRRRGGG